MLNQRSDKLELLRIAEAVATEKSIDKEIIITSMELAIQRAARTRFGSDNDIRAIVDRESGDIGLYKVLKIVQSPENLDTEISLEHAIKKENKENKEKKLLFEIFDNQKKLIAKGGRGGKGNSGKANSIVQYPLLAEKGEKGEQLEIEMNYLILSDVAIVGRPNSGKSTFLSKITNARPKINIYPYTTTGIETGTFETVKKQYKIIEIPGIENKKNNLGLKYLKHIERARVIVFLCEGENDNTIEIIKEKNQNLLKNKSVIIIKSHNNIDEKQTQISVKEILLIKTTIENVLLEDIKLKPKNIDLDIIKINPEEKQNVIKSKDGFEIIHPQIIRIAEKINLNKWDVMAQFMKVLHQKGIAKTLLIKGVKEGDIVKIGSITLEWN